MRAGPGAAFLAGVASFLSPCVLPLVPVYLAYLTGATYDELVASAPRRRTTAHAAAFILGFTAVFVSLGASATCLGQLLLYHRGWIARLGGALLVFLGLWMAGLVPAGFLYRDMRVHLLKKPAGYAGSVLVGAAFAAGWTPCVGPVLASILLVASRSDSVAYGVILLLAYSLGLAVPLLACSLALERSLKFIRRITPVLPAMEKMVGICLALMGGLLLSGGFAGASVWALGRFSGWARLMGGLGL